jgi:hypothetical protein
MKNILLPFIALIFATQAHAVDLEKVEKELTGDGVVGWIHGAVVDRELWVFTYRTPGDFFDYVELALIPKTPEIAAQFKTLSRHDRVKIHGEIVENPSPQPHLFIDAVEVVEKYANPHSPPAYEYSASIPKDLLGLESARFLVHAVVAENHGLVVEYRDQVIPIGVRDASLVKGLSRNDVVELRFKVRSMPSHPAHLALDEENPNAVKSLQSVLSLHGTPADVTGALVLFPKSPEIRFDVFAVEDPTFPDVKRQFTLVNMEDPDAFAKIRAKLKAAWDRRATAFVNGRNKLVSTCVKVRARGTFNEVSVNQANAQILLKSADDVDVVDGGDSCGSRGAADASATKYQMPGRFL